MDYTVILNDRSYDLPKRTLAVMDKLEDVIRTDTRAGVSLRDKYRKTYDCVADLIGRENAAECIGATLDDCDVNDITLAFRKIVDAYNRPLDDYNNAKGLGEINNLPIDKLTTLVEAAKQADKLTQGRPNGSPGALSVVK